MTRRFTLLSFGLLLALVIAACGGSDEAAAPPTFTPLPRPTATPRSTPLPDVEAPTVLGSADKPVGLLFVLPDAGSDELEAVDALQQQLNQELGEDLAVRVEALNTMQAAITAMCGGQPALMWVDAFTYIAAERACGATPLLGIRQTRQAGGVNGVTFDIVYDARLRPFPTGVAELRGRTVCRISSNDPLSWIYPSLALRAAGVDPVKDLKAVVDVADSEALVKAIFDETCEAGAIPAGQLDAIVRDLGNARPAVEINQGAAPDLALLPVIWPEVPYGVLAAPPDVVLPPNLRELLMTALQELIDDPAKDDTLKKLVNYNNLSPRDAGDYDEFRQWLEAARWGMSN
jgi:ABC-type phosphate/phosphonate transport system substrate-binding protein